MGMKLFTENGTFKPSDYGITNDDTVNIVAVGGGGGGTYNGGCSGCPAYYSGKLKPDNSYAITIGKGGTGSSFWGKSSKNTDGTNGGATSFGNLVTALGGQLGVGSNGNLIGGAIGGRGAGGGGAGGFVPNSPGNFINGGNGGGGDSFGNGGGGGSSSAPAGASHGVGGSGGSGSGGGGSTYGATGGSIDGTDCGGGGAGGGYGGGGGGCNHSGDFYGIHGGNGAPGCVLITW